MGFFILNTFVSFDYRILLVVQHRLFAVQVSFLSLVLSACLLYKIFTESPVLLPSCGNPLN